MMRCGIIGGGVIGLSLGYELARRGWQVFIAEKGRLGREASWAGAGILPPANPATALHPVEQLRALSHGLHVEWSRLLNSATGIDNGLRRCGAIYLARTAGEAAAVAAMASTMAEEQIACRPLSAKDVIRLEPALESLVESGGLKAAYELPDECQIRNPRHLQALESGCRQLGVEIHEQCEVTGLVKCGDCIASVRTSAGDLAADAFAITAGAWTEQILSREQVTTGIFPMRGQMVLFRCQRPPLSHVLNDGPRYLVPRDDGYVLAGSTEEEVGFDTSTTYEAIADLTQFALDLVPALRKATVERTWAGLRPASYDGLPYIGRMPGVANAFVAAGHFRSGLHLSPGTAVVLADLMCGVSPAIDLSPFRVSRG